MKGLIPILIGLLVVGCGVWEKEASVAQPNNKSPEWGKSGSGIFIDEKLKTLKRESVIQKPFCGSRSKSSIPPNTPVIVSLFSGDAGKMHAYVGLTTKDVNVQSWTTNRPDQYCLYFAGGHNYSGVHDSEFGRTRSSDWRPAVVPAIKSGDKLTILYEKEKGSVIFKIDKKVVYKSIGFEGDLYLSGSVRYPNEKITIEDLIK